MQITRSQLRRLIIETLLKEEEYTAEDEMTNYMYDLEKNYGDKEAELFVADILAKLENLEYGVSIPSNTKFGRALYDSVKANLSGKFGREYASLEPKLLLGFDGQNLQVEIRFDFTKEGEKFQQDLPYGVDLDFDSYEKFANQALKTIKKGSVIGSMPVEFDAGDEVGPVSEYTVKLTVTDIYVDVSEPFSDGAVFITASIIDDYGRPFSEQWYNLGNTILAIFGYDPFDYDDDGSKLISFSDVKEKEKVFDDIGRKIESEGY